MRGCHKAIEPKRSVLYNSQSSHKRLKSARIHIMVLQRQRLSVVNIENI